MLNNINRVTALISWIIVMAGWASFAQTPSDNGPLISGNLVLDTIWEPRIYLSYIPTFTDMNTMSREMIIAETTIDSSGAFSFSSLYLPEKDNLYRLHVSKKDAPAASLIIGGAEENHIFVIANKHTSLRIENRDSSGLFSKPHVIGYAPNQSLQAIDLIASYIDSTESAFASISRDFVSKDVHEQLRRMADTSQNSLVSLYALHLSKFESTYLSHKDFFDNYLEKWAHEDSSYFLALKGQIQKENPPQKSNWLWYALGFFILGFGLNFTYNKIKKRTSNQLKALSIQERKIFELMRSGYSNKEISEEHNISISTVKSHVSNIYNKLNIKSRKEVVDYLNG